MRNLFVEVTGQHDNIGDSLLRRGMLDAIRHPDIQLHIRIGEDDSYTTGLGLQAADITYRERTDWEKAIGTDRGRGNSSFLANAGEVIRVRGPRYLRPKVLRQLIHLRRRGGALLHTGVGVRDLETSPRLAKLSALRFFDMVTWRDAASRDYAGVGEVQPDWGFATGSENIATDATRDVLAVSVRGDRDQPDEEWSGLVRSLADALNLRIVTFSQVMRDSALAETLGRTLKADDVLRWNSADHAPQEARVRELFRRSVGVVSDRVHGLIMGATEGAYPIGLPPRPNAKSLRTLAPVGFPLYVRTADDWSASIDRLGEHDLLQETTQAVAHARTTLSSRAKAMTDEVLAR